MNLRCNILHIEDDDNDSLFFQRALARVEFAGAYRRTNSVEDAMSYLLGQAHYADRRLFPLPNVIVVDSGIAGNKGACDFLVWLESQEAFKAIVRVALTGGMAPEAENRMLSQGVAAVLSKGTTLPEFCLSVEDILRKCV